MNDRGSIVVGWLARLAIMFAVLGVGAYDLVSVTQANVGAADEANQAASEAATNFKTYKNLQMAYDVATRTLSHDGDTIETKNFTVNQAGMVSLTVDRTPKTLWMHRLGFTKHWTKVRQGGTGAPPS